MNNKKSKNQTNEKSYPDNPLTLSSSILEEPVMPYGLPQEFDMIQLSRSGVLKSFLIDLAQRLSFSMQEIARVLHVSERTLHRYKDEDTLSSTASERTLLLTDLYKKGIAVLGDANNFQDWLRTPLPAFQQNCPMDYLDTAFGFKLIKDELGRIEHGVFA